MRTKTENRRYYLHQRLLHNNISYDPHKRIIELCAVFGEDVKAMRQRDSKVMSYVQELFSDYNYIIQKVITKANESKKHTTRRS